MTLSTVAASTAAPTSASSLGLQDFVRVLTTQLTYQDPLKPMDNQAFMAQMAQFTTLEQAQQTNSNLQQLVTNQAALQSVGLIGRTVDVTTPTGPLTGTVSALSLAGSSPLLTLKLSDGTLVNDVELSQLTAVR